MLFLVLMTLGAQIDDDLNFMPTMVKFWLINMRRSRQLQFGSQKIFISGSQFRTAF
jgi:hypothetical protein